MLECKTIVNSWFTGASVHYGTTVSTEGRHLLSARACLPTPTSPAVANDLVYEYNVTKKMCIILRNNTFKYS